MAEKKSESVANAVSKLINRNRQQRLSMSQLKVFYDEQVAPQLLKEFAYQNCMQAPRIEKIVLNMGLGDAIQNIKILDSAVLELASISGQKPVITKSKKAIAAFKLRENMPIGCMVTLRRNRMYDFF